MRTPDQRTERNAILGNPPFDPTATIGLGFVHVDHVIAPAPTNPKDRRDRPWVRRCLEVGNLNVPTYEYVQPTEVDGAFRFDLRDGVYEVANVMNANGGRSRAWVLVDSIEGGVYKASNPAKLFQASYAGLLGEDSSVDGLPRRGRRRT